MPRPIVVAPLSVALALALTALDAAPALAGPPWISVEYPVNPHHRDTRGALMLAHTYHHSRPMHFPLGGTAEGLVAGQRRSLPLEIAPTATAGVYAVRGRIPREGAWVVVLTMRDTLGSSTARASALIALGPQGDVGTVNVPFDLVKGRVIPRGATAADVEEMLRIAADGPAEPQRVLGYQPGLSAARLPLATAALGLLLLLPLGFIRRAGRGPGAGR